MNYNVLDKGFVKLVDHMGSDSAVVQAARISYGAGTKTVNEDRGLIRYLMRHHHTTPFEMCVVKLHVRCPMDCWRQWIRHRTASVNEYSTRYSEAIDDKAVTLPDDWRMQSTTNKQGSMIGLMDWPDPLIVERKSIQLWEVKCGEIVLAQFDHEPSPGEYLSLRESEAHRAAQTLYDERLLFGVAREQARKDLPLSTYTEAYWKCDLHNLFHFLRLRMDSHAQLEIRLYAQAIGEIVEALYPLCWEAFVDYRLEARSFSRMELKLIGHMIQHPNLSVQEILSTMNHGLGEREQKEFIVKVDKVKKDTPTLLVARNGIV